MKKLNLRMINGFLLAALAISMVTLGGCSAGPQDVDHTGEKDRTAAATDMASIFKKAKGNWDSLSDADKATFTKAAGGTDLNARAAWAGMKDGPGAAQAVMRDAQGGGGGSAPSGGAPAGGAPAGAKPAPGEPAGGH